MDSLKHFDDLDSTLFLTGSDGTVTDKYTYDAWGSVTSHTDSTQQPYQYVGQLGYYTHYQDPNLGLLQLGVRFYEPGIGRFTQRDPMQDDENCSAYRYGDDNPIAHVDPTGEWLWDIIRCLYRWSRVMNVWREAKRKFPIPNCEDECENDYIKRIVDYIDDKLGKNYVRKTIEICAKAGMAKSLPGCKGRY